MVTSSMPQFESNHQKNCQKEAEEQKVEKKGEQAASDSGDAVERKRSADQIAALLEQSSEGEPFDIGVGVGSKADDQSASPSIIFAEDENNPIAASSNKSLLITTNEQDQRENEAQYGLKLDGGVDSIESHEDHRRTVDGRGDTVSSPMQSPISALNPPHLHNIIHQNTEHIATIDGPVSSAAAEPLRINSKNFSVTPKTQKLDHMLLQEMLIKHKNAPNMTLKQEKEKNGKVKGATDGSHE